MTAAAPAVYANFRADGRLANPLPDVVVVPIALLNRNPGSSCLLALTGDRKAELFRYGECNGVDRNAGWLILDDRFQHAADCATVFEVDASSAWASLPHCSRLSSRRLECDLAVARYDSTSLFWTPR